MNDTKTELWLIRHGETEWSLSGAHTSRTDIPLTQRGRERASAIHDYLHGRQFSLVLTSPLQRARETCRIAGYADAAQVDENLREWDYGEYEGRATAEIRKTTPAGRCGTTIQSKARPCHRSQPARRRSSIARSPPVTASYCFPTHTFSGFLPRHGSASIQKLADFSHSAPARSAHSASSGRRASSRLGTARSRSSKEYHSPRVIYCRWPFVTVDLQSSGYRRNATSSRIHRPDTPPNVD